MIGLSPGSWASNAPSDALFLSSRCSRVGLLGNVILHVLPLPGLFRRLILEFWTAFPAQSLSSFLPAIVYLLSFLSFRALALALVIVIVTLSTCSDLCLSFTWCSPCCYVD
jgi:hypothetical protein